MARHPIADEVERRMELLGLTSKGLSKAAGVNETYVRDLLTGRSQNPKADQISKLAQALNCTLDDLRRPHASLSAGGSSLAVQDDALTAIPEIDAYIGMGGGGIDDQVVDRETESWGLPTAWLRGEVRGDLKNLRILTLEGDSMAGTLEPGDKVLVDLERRTPSPPGLFVVYDGVSLLAKRLEYISGSHPASVRIISDNSRYAPYERVLDEVTIIGRIMGRWQRLS